MPPVGSAGAGRRRGRLRDWSREAVIVKAASLMTDHRTPKRIFPSSKVDAQAAKHVPSSPQTESAAYKLAFQDTDFLLREDLRPVRFQLELLKPELLLDEAKIASTFVVYGSARIPEPSMADALIAGASDEQQRAIAE